MQLTRYTDLGLRIMMRLAAVDDAAATTKSVASQMAVSYTHAAKVVSHLQGLGLVETRRGRAGGLQITDAGRHYSAGRLARELEGRDEVIDCEGLECPLRNACRLRRLLREAQEAFFAVLDPWTIDELSAQPTATVLLALSAGPPS